MLVLSASICYLKLKWNTYRKHVDRSSGDGCVSSCCFGIQVALDVLFMLLSLRKKKRGRRSKRAEERVYKGELVARA